MKRLYIIAALLLGFMGAAEAQTIVVYKTDGTKVTYQASEVKSVEFVGEAKNTYAGSWTGKDSVIVAGTMKYLAEGDLTYIVTDNADGTINVVVPEHNVPKTAVGDLTLGTYTVSNIPLADEQHAYYKDFSDDKVQFHFTAPTMGMDKDYVLNQASISVSVSEGQITISLAYMPGRSPMNITEKFVGKK